MVDDEEKRDNDRRRRSSREASRERGKTEGSSKDKDKKKVDPRKQQKGVVEAAWAELKAYVASLVDIAERAAAKTTTATTTTATTNSAQTAPGYGLLAPGAGILTGGGSAYGGASYGGIQRRPGLSAAVAHAFQVEEEDEPRVEPQPPPPPEPAPEARSRSRSARGERRKSNPRSPKRAKRTSFNFGDEPDKNHQVAATNASREVSKYGLRGFDNKAQAPDTQNADGFGQHVLNLAQVQIRCLLGKNGATIQSIMRQTGAQIVVRSPPSAYEGVVTVSGNFQPALKLIEELLASKGCPLTDRPAMGLGDAPGIIEVPDGLIGQLIGRTAFFVEVQAKLGTETVIQRLPYTSPSGKRLVQVAGDNWLEAKQMVEQWVQSFSGGRKINGHFRPSQQDMITAPFGMGAPMGTPMGAPMGAPLPPPALTSTPAIPNAPSNPSWRL